MRDYCFNLILISSLNDWWDMYTQVVRGPRWELFGRNRDAYADSLSGGPGCPDRPCRFIFTHVSALCGERVLQITRDELTRKRSDCHSSHVPNIDAQLLLLKCGIGETLLTWILQPLYGQDDIDVYLKAGA